MGIHDTNIPIPEFDYSKSNIKEITEEQATLSISEDILNDAESYLSENEYQDFCDNLINVTAYLKQIEINKNGE